MKLLFALLFFILSQTTIASTYYISPAGSDANGNGTINNPWKSLNKATSAITQPGNIIHVMAGNYMEVSRSFLAVGVSIEGEGVLSIIQSTLTEEFVAIIIATSPEGTDGNQHISNIKLDGNNRTTSWGIEIRGRKNISIHDCVITDFEDRGIIWAGQGDNKDGAPEIYATGNSFYNNTVTNCAKYDGYGRGCLNIGGQEGMLIYNNTITQTGRKKGTNGWPIKYFNEGFLRGCKIYNNIIIKAPYDEVSWDFAIELFNEFGLEIYNNTVIGSIDLNHQNKGGYSYSAYVHNNIIGPKTMQPQLENGIILEFETENAIIENNQFNNTGGVVNFTPRPGNFISNVFIRNNTCNNIGVANQSHKGFAVMIGGETNDPYSYTIRDLLIENNKFYANSTQTVFWGIAILGASYANNIKIKGNAIKNFSAGCITANAAIKIDTFITEHNILQNNGNFNSPSFFTGRPKHYISKNNSSSNTSSFSLIDIKMNIIRPLYYEIKAWSLLEFVGIISVFLAFLFCRKENIYFFPTILISILTYSLLSIENNSALGIFIAIYCAAASIYGWRLWLKRDRRKHRVVRINSSTKRQVLLQAILFLSLSIIALLLLFMLREDFNNWFILCLHALSLAAGCTGMYLIVSKKIESLYWLTGTAALFIFYYYFINYISISFLYCLFLIAVLWILYKWKKRLTTLQKNKKVKLQ